MLWDRLLGMLEKSIIVSGIIALACVGAVIYLAITGQTIPELLQNVTLIIVGFFFGAKSQNTGTQAYVWRKIMDSGEMK